jgi:GT2 family glycosyltransferase
VKELSVVVVSYNTRDLLADCLRSVMKETDALDAEVWVVDNASGDGSCERVELEFPDVRLLRNQENLGFGRANNQAIQRVEGEFTLLLNPDATLTEGALAPLLDCMRRDEGIGLVGPRLVYPNGRPQPSVFTFPHPLLDLLVLRLPGVRRLARFSPSPEQRREVDWLLGAALLCRTDVLRGLEGFDDRYFMFGEEKDLQLRMDRLGFRRVFVPDGVVVHHKAQAVQQAPVRNFVEMYRSMDLYLTLHHPRAERVVFRTAWILALAARAALSRLVPGRRRRRGDRDDEALRHLVPRWLV